MILEALASGLAIIATNVGAIASMVNEKNGWLIEPTNTIQLEKVMIEAINSKDLLSKKEHSLQLVNTTFNWEIIAKKTIEALSSNK